MSLLRLLALSLFLVSSPSFLALAEGLPIPPLSGPVVDQAGVLHPEAHRDLERKLWELKTLKGSEIAVLIVPSTQPEEIEQFSARVVDAWKLGRNGIDDGVLLLVALNDRRVRIEVGRGLEGDIPDVKAFRIIDELMLPHFRQDDVSGGVLAGVNALDRLIRGIDLPAPQDATTGSNRLHISSTVFGYVIGVLVEPFLGLLIGAGVGGLVTFVIAYALLSTGWAIVLGVFVALLVIAAHAIQSPRGGGYGSGGTSSGRRESWISGDSLSSGSFGGGGSFGSGGSFSGGGSSGRW